MLIMDQGTNNVIDLRTIAATPKEPAPSIGPSRIEWEAKEYEHIEKDFQWFLTAGIVAFGIFASLLIFKNIFGAATLLLFSIVMYMYATKKPEALSVIIDMKGISVNEKLIPYSSITSFWVLYEPPVKDLIIIRKEHFLPKTIIPLGSAHPVEVRSILLTNAIKEKEEEESLTDILARRVGF